MSISKRASVGVSCVVIGLALHVSTAFAALSDNPPSLKVTYRDVDLQSAAGAQDLYRRIKLAATEVCLAASDRKNFTGSPSPRARCVDLTIDKAVRDVDHPLVSSLWKRQTRVA